MLTLAVLSSLPLLGTGPDTGSFRFEEVGVEMGLKRLVGRDGGARHDYGPLWMDLDGDPWIDLVFMNHSDPPSLYENRKGERFVDRQADSGLRHDDWEYPQHADRHGGACGDFDNDGDFDLYISHGAMRGETLGVKYDEILRNEGKFRFTELTGPANKVNTQGRARLPVWSDLDGDGRLDLLVGNFASKSTVLRNQGGGRFLDQGREVGLSIDNGAHPSWSDYDGDGDPDVLLLWPARLFRNDGKDGFSDVTVESGLGTSEGEPTASSSWADFDGDGDPDLFLSSWKKASNRLYLNDRGRLRRVEGVFGSHPDERGAGVAAGDLDNDGDVDLVIVGTRRLSVLRNLGGGSFEPPSALVALPLVPGRDGDVALADFDNDGDLDAAVNAEDGQHLLRNSGGAGSWLTVSFDGRVSNRAGFGAKVTAVLDDGRVVFREHLGDTGFFKSSSCAPIHLGLGDATRVDLVVRWPSGIEHTMKGVQTNRAIVIREPSP